MVSPLPTHSGSPIEFATLQDPVYTSNEHHWEPSHLYWTAPEQVNGKIHIVHWLKCALESGAVKDGGDVKVALLDGGMTVELLSKRPKQMVDPTAHYEEELNKHWGKDKVEYNKVSKRKDDEVAEITNEKNHYKKNHEWNVFRKTLDKQCDETAEVYYFHIHNPPDGSGKFLKVGLLEAQTDIFVKEAVASFSPSKEG